MIPDCMDDTYSLFTTAKGAQPLLGLGLWIISIANISSQ